jgi:Family of unknown function (DUF6157)
VVFKKNAMHTTNYINTFIEVAEDCPVQSAEIPPRKGEVKSVANLHFEIVEAHPYQYTSDDVIFKTFAFKNSLENNLDNERNQFFSKGQACMRCSPLTKRYGWGVHSNEEGKIAIFPLESEEYQRFLIDNNVKRVKAMRSKKA